MRSESWKDLAAIKVYFPFSKTAYVALNVKLALAFHIVILVFKTLAFLFGYIRRSNYVLEMSQEKLIHFETLFAKKLLNCLNDMFEDW